MRPSTEVFHDIEAWEERELQRANAVLDQGDFYVARELPIELVNEYNEALLAEKRRSDESAAGEDRG